MSERVIARNQGMSITPIDRLVDIIWQNDTDIWYRFVGDREVKQTPRKRFFEIVEEVYD
jgi:hypothetical protein